LTTSFHLRKGVRFSNGVELTANDVKFSLTRPLDPHLKPAVSWGRATDEIFEGSQDFVAGRAKSVSGIRGLDRYTIRFVLAQPVAVLPYIRAESRPSPAPRR
jgi:peptide/nickel transport system substrate-binding protein/oligopeptide transport system substrate-binding protein